MIVLGLSLHHPRRRVIQFRFQRVTGENIARLDAPPARSMTARFFENGQSKGPLV